MTNINDIKSSEWSLAISGEGNVVEGFDDINQCIRLILSTEKGSDPLRPDFGSDIWRYISYPIQEAAPLMVREIVDAIGTWEQRIELTEVTYEYGDTERQGKKIDFNILWVLEGTDQKGISLLSFDLIPERQQTVPAVAISPLAVPLNLTAEYVNFEGLLNWEYGTTVGVTFQIIRSVDGGLYQDLTSVVGVTTYTDSSVEFGKTYRYRVRAVKRGRFSDFSNEAILEGLTSILTFTSSNPDLVTFDKTGNAPVKITDGGVTDVYVIDNDAENISAFYADEALDADTNAGITGTLDLSGLIGLRTVRARNQSFTFIPGTWVRNEDVYIDLSNSITTPARVTDLINSIIIANGGTTTDDGSQYTGLPGETHANRTLVVGSILLDLSDPENGILYDKILALESVGWTITTIQTLCQKTFNVNTGGGNSFVTTLEKSRRLLNFETDFLLLVDLYDTYENALLGGATGILAEGYTAVNVWLLNDTNFNSWIYGTNKGLRFYSPNPSDTGMTGIFSYLSLPTETRPCGLIPALVTLEAYLTFDNGTSYGLTQVI